ncbi:MAG: hypothetical protein ABIR17_05815 [Pseudolysinimonas sp.]|uniref:hypothetical protein n=1 Tax=Pseudolysinimonas sp. TaxID=2680009 RepID=UPI003266F9CE
MKITYDTVSDSISSPDLNPEQTARLQATLVRALARNEPVQKVAAMLLAAASSEE